MHLRLSVHEEVAIIWHVHTRFVKLTNFKVDKNNIFYRISGHLSVKRLDIFSQL